MVDDTRITQHFRSDEIGFIEQVQGWIRQANDEYRPILTHFLNPRERLIAESLVNSEDDLKHASNGGYPDAEMQRMLIYPAYHEVVQADFELQVLQIVYPVKFAEIKHHQILGTLANQGIERNIFGDIVGNGDIWQFVVEQKMVDFFNLQIDHIGKVKVHLIPIKLQDMIRPDDDWESMTTTVASLRLDTVISTCFNFSRSRIKAHIETGNVRVNWREMDKPDYELAINDIVSVRRFGRLQVTEVNGLTKKEKIKITVVMIKNKKK
ncbi:YlmH family RNA-binding protein [Periweissella fabalis]|uniref:RNA-binding protein n=1 Tax=Periweissella fabalis TaxID=1070421 RepID=A0A7X6N3Z8_9LACO|nr:RNA-binding protein [Periweissella fabalis]MCM0598786.1 RNA-binding protein [Periweissella fabalis]NKZ24615.1 RNA-binding protein [Periweissella fabalis]